ncbi:LytR/AlgR family response regulator transcription factor [Dyella mobilis]|uniref:Response regulator transcription factor n=1 Tax=Dyella mobilis TaxID=1849582 RepID=A0ABS2KCU9_9GAMM|nr:LytTR family DNA-binding domain-containing protein [Dyella mobilis]MBM7128994.1 response regulator transcription factor [Dyella mobilis]GLQ99311.1 DNA-binding response regulator [Dyella mobilis]
MTAPITALIAEDEEPQRTELRGMLARLWPELVVVAECDNGIGALDAWMSKKPDVVFLDIRMPGLSGLDVARQAGSPAQVVFITAHDEFAIKAFDAGAIDYLLKPIRADRLTETITRLRSRQPATQVDLTALIDTLAGRLKPVEMISWITASIGDTLRMIHIGDVILFQSEEKYTRVATVTDSAYIRTPLKDLIPKLDPEIFWRVHRNAIVRVSAIRQVKPDGDGRLLVWLHGITEPLRVSDAFRHRFRAM